MADSGYYPRSLPRTLDSVELDPILRRYHKTADRVDDLMAELRRSRRIANRRKIKHLMPREKFLVVRINRFLTECQGYRELVLIAQDAPDSDFKEFPLLCAEIEHYGI